MVNPYGDGTAAATIARILATVPLDGLLIKQPIPLPKDANPESAESLATLKGTGFSPYINPTETAGALAPEESFSENQRGGHPDSAGPGENALEHP
jgi:hypothetical protein